MNVIYDRYTVYEMNLDKKSMFRACSSPVMRK